MLGSGYLFLDFGAERRHEMKKSLLVILAAMLVLATVFTLLTASPATSPVSAQTNLIQNPGFEQPTADGNNTPTGWGTNGTSPYRSNTVFHGGNYSAYLYNASSYYEQRVDNLVAETFYVFMAYSKANAYATEKVVLNIYDSDDNVIDTISASGTGHGWVKNIIYIDTPTTADYVVITLSMVPVGDGGTAEAWFDDIVLQDKRPSWCFIATAAYGTPLAGEIDVLRQFRDEYMLTNPAGRLIVSLYYESSPPLANFIGKNEGLRAVTRMALEPIIWLCSRITAPPSP